LPAGTTFFRAAHDLRNFGDALGGEFVFEIRNSTDAF
jgi:hypothetical protein